MSVIVFFFSFFLSQGKSFVNQREGQTAQTLQAVVKHSSVSFSEAFISSGTVSLLCIKPPERNCKSLDTKANTSIILNPTEICAVCAVPYIKLTSEGCWHWPGGRVLPSSWWIYLTEVSWQQNCRCHDQNPDFPEKKVVIPIKIISAWQLLCLTYSGLTVP